MGSQATAALRMKCSSRRSSAMTTLTVRRIKDHFVVTGPDIEPMQFKSRPEARDGAGVIIGPACNRDR